MAHSNEFAGKSFAGKSAQVVDERRKHAPIITETLAFEEFDHWIDVALESLVDRWIHTAAPRAAQQRFWGRRFEVK